MGDVNGWTRIAEGNTSEIFDIGPNRILKLFKDGIPFEVCVREFENTSVARDLLQKVPGPLEVIEVDGKYGIVYEKVTGTNMLEEMLSHIWTIRKQSRNLARYHADIQKNITGKLETVKEKLKRDILAADLLDAEEKNRILGYMGTLPDGDILCHFDFHPGNIMIRENNPVIIDWMTACMGDKGADVARTGIMLKYGEVPRSSRLIQIISHAVQNDIYKAYLKEYKRITGIEQQDIDKWELPIAAGRLHEWLTKKEKMVLLAFVKCKLAELP